MFSSCDSKFFVVRHIHYLVNTSNDSVTVHLHKGSEKIRIKRGVGLRQGDTISPKLFTATLERLSIFRRLNLNWENKGVKIDG